MWCYKTEESFQTVLTAYSTQVHFIQFYYFLHEIEKCRLLIVKFNLSQKYGDYSHCVEQELIYIQCSTLSSQCSQLLLAMMFALPNHLNPIN